MMPETTLEIPDFFTEQIKNLSAYFIKHSLIKLLEEIHDDELEFDVLNSDCDEYVNSLEELDKLLLARFMLNQLIEKVQNDA